MMRIAVLHWGRTGAGPLFAYELTRALRDGGSEVVASYSLDAEIADRFAQLGVASFPIRTYRDRRGAILGLPRLVAQSFRLDRFFRRHGVDVVVVAMEHLWQGVVAPMLRLGGRRTLLCIHDATMHPGDFSRLEHLMRLAERRAADGALVFSSDVASRLADIGPFAPGRIHQTVHAAYVVDGGLAPARASRPDDVPVVGFFGRLSAYKGLDLGTRAIAEVRARGVRVRFRVVGAGGADATPALDHDDDELQNRWVASGEVPEVIAGFDLLLLPYTEASQSGVLAYAMALGVPAVVTPVGGLVEQATTSGAAVVAAAVTPSALADALEVVLTDAVRRRALSEAGLAAAAGPFSWWRVADDVRRAAAAVRSQRP